MKNKLTKEDIQFREKIHLKNLKRKYSKIIQHADQTDEAIKIKKRNRHIRNTMKIPLYFSMT